MLSRENLEKAVALRHLLHEHPELSREEVQTKKTLMEAIEKNAPSFEIVDKGHWFYAHYTSKHLPAGDKPGAVAFRADMDALKVMEDASSLPYASKNPGVAHKCGHDGHCAALVAYAMDVEENGADRDVCLVFQHAEENGSGAIECMDLFDEVRIDEIYALHNLPGKAFGSLHTRPGTINLASVGIDFDFTGTPTHASTPELGRNPAKAISKMVMDIDDIVAECGKKGLLMATVIQIDLGERAFGVSASHGKLLLTARGEVREEQELLVERLNQIAETYGVEFGLELKVSYYDEFPETCNSEEVVSKVQKLATEGGMELQIMPEAMRTSEDFGYFLRQCKGALVWIGAGEKVPPLHDKDFDFNDDLIPVHVRIMRMITDQA